MNYSFRNLSDDEFSQDNESKNNNKEIRYEPNPTNPKLSTGLQIIESLPQESTQ